MGFDETVPLPPWLVQAFGFKPKGGSLARLLEDDPLQQSGELLWLGDVREPRAWHRSDLALQSELEKVPNGANLGTGPSYALPRWARLLLWPFMIAAAVGCGLMASAHVAAWFGHKLLSKQLWEVLSPAMFVVYAAAIFPANYLARDVPSKHSLKAIFRGCPPWAVRMVYILFGYVWVGFFVFRVLLKSEELSGEIGLTSALMLFYAIACAIHYSAIHATDARPRCPLGHPVSWGAKFCEECGQAVMANRI